jgi:hypothetical protein
MNHTFYASKFIKQIALHKQPNSLRKRSKIIAVEFGLNYVHILKTSETVLFSSSVSSVYIQ